MKVKEKKMENEARKRQENCADPHGFLRATRETVVDKRREYPAVINYETFATVGNSYKKKCTISYIFPLMPVVRAYSRAVRQEDRRIFRIVNRIRNLLTRHRSFEFDQVKDSHFRSRFYDFANAIFHGLISFDVRSRYFEISRTWQIRRYKI